MKKLIILTFPLFIYAQSLKSLIESAELNNNLVIAKEFIKEAKHKNIDSKKSSYLPTFDIGGFYQSSNAKPIMEAGDVYSGYAKIGFDIYDGGKKSALLQEAKSEYKAADHDTHEIKKSLALDIIENFYAVKNFQASLKAKEDAKNSLQEQLLRVKKYFEAGLATKDDIQRLQAAYDTNMYEIESIKLQIATLFKYLELKTGVKVDKLDESGFKKFTDDGFEQSDIVKSLIAKKNALLSSAESISSAYYPYIKIEDSYSLYGYDRSNSLHPKGLDNQNKIVLSANMRIFDFKTLDKSKEAVMLSAKALANEILYKAKEQKADYEIAVLKINTQKIKIKSASSALEASSSAFKTIEEKYSAGIVDYVVYLDALKSRTDAYAVYKSALNELETAYAMYYYYSGKNLTEYIK